MLLFSPSVVSDSLWPHGLQHTRLPCWHLTISQSLPTFMSVEQPSHPLFPSSPSAFNLSQHQGPFQWVGSLHQVARVLELQYQSFQWIFRLNFLQDWLVWSSCCPGDSQESSSPEPLFESINSSALCLLHSPTLTSVHDYWKDHSLDYTDLYWQSDVFAF